MRIAATVLLLRVLAVPVGAQIPTWRLAPTDFAVGGGTQDERYVLSDVVGATRLPDGRVVVADRFVQGLRVFDAAGTFARRVGREGEGPGEYAHIRGIGPCAVGRIAVFDLHWNLKMYDRDLTLLEDRSPEIPGLGGSAYSLACEPSGTVVATGWGDFRGQTKPGYYVATAPIVLVRDGAVVHDFGERLSSERVGAMREGRLSGSGPHPFGRKTSVAIGGGRVYLGDAAGYEIEVYDLEGRPLPPVRWSGPSQEITRELFEAFVDGYVSRRSEARRPATRRFLRDLPELERFPAYDELQVDLDGRLWVRQYPQPGATSATWVVFDGGGRMVGRLELPLTTTLLEPGGEQVVVVERDEFEVETVRVMRVIR